MFVLLASLTAIPLFATAADDKPYVEIDLSSLPAKKGCWKYKLTVHTTDKEYSFEDEVGAGSTGAGDLTVMAEVLVMRMAEVKFQAKVVGKTKIRVYGRTYNDGFLPATEGLIESKVLKPEELPKVKNPPKA